MNFQQFLMVFSICGLILLVPILLRAICDEYNFHPLGDNLRAIRRMSLLSLIVPCVFFAKLYVHGSTKTNTPPAGTSGTITNEPPAGLPPLMTAPRQLLQTTEPSTGFSTEQIAAQAVFVSVGTNEVWDFSPPQGATVVEKWRRRGAANERVEIVENVEIDTFGQVRTLDRVFSPLGVQVGMVPEANWAMIGRESLAWWMTTASNTTVVCWQNALLGRDTNTPVSVQAEFFDNGRFEYRYDLSAAGAEARNIVSRVSTTNGEET